MSEPVVTPDVPEEAGAANMSWGRRIRRALLGLFAGLAVAAVAGYFLGVRPAEVAKHVAGVSPWVLLFCVASAGVNLVLCSFRWHLVMRPVIGLTYSQAFRAHVVGQMFNALLPMRGGDLLRVQYLGRRTGKSRGTILGTEVVDRWLDWFGWTPVLIVTTLVAGVPRWMFTAGAMFGGLLLTWGVAMIVLTRRGWKPRPGSRIGAMWASFQSGITAFGSRRTLTIALLVAPLTWLWESCALIVAASGFGIHLSFPMAFSVLIGFNLAMVVPSPGAIGSVETGGTAALVFFGVDQSQALAFMFVYHFTQLLPCVATGAGILVFEGERLFGRRRRVPEATGGT